AAALLRGDRGAETGGDAVRRQSARLEPSRLRLRTERRAAGGEKHAVRVDDALRARVRALHGDCARPSRIGREGQSARVAGPRLRRARLLARLPRRGALVRQPAIRFWLRAAAAPAAATGSLDALTLPQGVVLVAGRPSVDPHD